MPAGGFEVAEIPEQGKAGRGVPGIGMEELPAEAPAGGVQGAAVVTVVQGQAPGEAGQVAVEGPRFGRAARVELLHLGCETLGRWIATAAGHGRVLRSARRAER
jgi:hypothetical protein